MRLTRSEAMTRRRKIRLHAAHSAELQAPEARTIKTWRAKEVKRLEKVINKVK